MEEKGRKTSIEEIMNKLNNLNKIEMNNKKLKMVSWSNTLYGNSS